MKSRESGLVVIEVAGSANDYRSPVHDNAAAQLEAAGADFHRVHVSSVVVGNDAKTGRPVASQMPPAWQLEQIKLAAQYAKEANRIPVALGHSFGTVAALAAVREGIIPAAVLASPVFLDPRRELMGSTRAAMSLQVMPPTEKESVPKVMIRGRNYSTEYPNDHLDDSLYHGPIIADEVSLAEVRQLTKDNQLRTFIGQGDWNVLARHYPTLTGAKKVRGEGHAFTIRGDKSAKTLANAILKLGHAQQA